MANIDIEDYIDEVRTSLLFRELKTRKEFPEYIKEYLEEQKPKYIIPEFETTDQILNFIKITLGLKPWHDKKRIIQEIESL